MHLCGWSTGTAPTFGCCDRSVGVSRAAARAALRGMTLRPPLSLAGDVDVPPASLDGLPLMLTIAETAVVLRISRTSAYKLAEEWRRTAGASGLPTVRLGSRLLVRRVDLAAIVGVAPAA